MAAASSSRKESWTPAAYGRTCTGCSRAKSKCFYRADEPSCERCCRIGLTCESSPGARKRKADSAGITPALHSGFAKLDQTGRGQDQGIGWPSSQATQTQPQPAQQALEPSSISEPAPSYRDPPPGYSNHASPAPEYCPDIAIDTTASAVQLLGPTGSGGNDPACLISQDVSIHGLTDRLAGEQLITFRRSFLPMFPLIHLPQTLSAADLRREKPFFWLVAMALTTKRVALQFSMEETIWQIISERIVCQHLANLDLLLGLICFSSWSHWFKKDKPFMTMLSQMAIAMASELRLYQQRPLTVYRRILSGRYVAEQQPSKTNPTLEERRTILALFHLTRSTWTAYRQTEPLSWTPYMDECLLLLSDGRETEFDALLAAQVKSQLVTMQLDPMPMDPMSPGITQLYLGNADLMIKKFLIAKPKVQGDSGLANFQRLQNLDSVLSSAEAWLAIFFDMNLSELVGMDVEFFAQFLHCLVVLFKLVTLDEPGWDVQEVKRRADVLEILHRSSEIVDEVPMAMGLVDCPGPRRGLFFKASHLLRAIKALLAAEMQVDHLQGDLKQPGEISSSNELSTSDFVLTDDFLQALAAEPWLSDISRDAWDLGFDNTFDISF
ncbi:hypothetical protein G7046_g4416 [Stylonectria norvegica]|nr:hypothetical protein G7046_g4416 [Stylonectria norvegica]